MSDFTTSPSAPQTQLRKKGIFDARFNLNIKLPLIAILLLALAFLISTTLSVRATQTALIDTLKGELTAQTDSKAELIRSNLIWTRSVAIDLAAAAEVSNYDEKTILNVIRNTLARNKQIYGSTIAYEPNQFQPNVYYWSPYYSRATAELQFTQLGNPEYDYFKWDWYVLPKAKKAPVLSPPYFDKGGGEIWMVTWSAPFFDVKTGAVKGVATADIAFSQTQEIVSAVMVGQNGYAFLLDPKGVIMGMGVHGGKYKIMEDSMLSIAQSSQDKEWENLTANMLAGKSGFANATDLQGRPMFVAYAPIGLDTGWSLGLAFPQAELFQKASDLQNTLIIYASLIAVIFGGILYLFSRSITEPIRRLTLYASRLSAEKLHLVDGKLENPIQIGTQDELEDLAEAFNHMATNLALTIETLEEKVADRTRNLERSSFQFATIAEVTRDITVVRDLDTLLNVAANLIRERFNYYHVGVFLIDNRGEFAILRAASGAAAQEMLEQNYKVRVGQEGLIGNVARTGQAQIALGVGAGVVHFQNPLLPHARSEMTLPLRSHSVSIGVLDIQADTPLAFDESSIKNLQLLADQLAVAIGNAQLAQQVEETLAELDNAYRSQTQQAWQSAINQRDIPVYEYDGLQVRAVLRRLPKDLLKRLESGKPVVVQEKSDSEDGLANTKNALMVPLMALNQVIGVIGLEQEDAEHNWTEEDIAIVEAAANRAAITLENARLLEESQRRAVKERAIFEATARIGAAMNVENILYATAEEIERVLGNSEVVLQFNNDNATSINDN